MASNSVTGNGVAGNGVGGNGMAAFEEEVKEEILSSSNSKAKAGLDDPLGEEAANLRAKFGDKQVPLDDRRLHHPHHVQPNLGKMAGEAKVTEELKALDDPLGESGELAGLKAKFGDKVVSLDDRRLHHPHSVKPNLHPKFEDGNLLQTSHRPTR